MWRIIKENNLLTGKICWVIEKKSGFLFKTWSRSYRIGNTAFKSPIKSYTKERAIDVINILESGDVIKYKSYENLV